MNMEQLIIIVPIWLVTMSIELAVAGFFIYTVKKTESKN